MNYLHQEVKLDADEIVEVTLDHPANVQLLSPLQFEDYRQGKPFQYLGGYYKESPVRIPAPYPGPWHVVVDLGGGPGMVRAALIGRSALRVIPDPAID